MALYGDGGYGDGYYGAAEWGDFPDTGGIPVVPNLPDGGLVWQDGQVQYGDTLLGSKTRAGLRELIGWRDLPDVEVSDSPRTQAHGDNPGTAYAGSAVVTGIFLLRGSQESKALALDAIERATRLDGVERPLVVADGAGSPTLRMAKVIGRTLPQDRNFKHAPVEVSVQWSCSDPRRYQLETVTASLSMVTTVGGLDYPLTYPLEYGTIVGNNSIQLSNPGSADAPLIVQFYGPLIRPGLSCPSAGWAMQFDTTLAEGEALTVDTREGTVRLNGDADRLYTITPTSDPIEGCAIPAGATAQVSLTAESGTGTASVAYRPAYL